MNPQAERCRRKALECERQAVLATEQTARDMFRDLALQWRTIAQEVEELERRRDDIQRTSGTN